MSRDPSPGMPLAGWSIMLAHGRSYIGKRPVFAEEGAVLSPVYWLEAQLQPSPNGRDGALDFRCLPILMLASWDHVRIPAGAILRDLEELALEERRAIARAVAKVEDVIAGMRATRAGVVLR